MSIFGTTEESVPDGSQSTSIEYTAQAESMLVSGEVKLTITDKELSVIALLDAASIPFAEINDIDLIDYTVAIRADSGDYSFSRMGSWCSPFYDALCDAYNKAVLRSLFIKSSPLVTAKGVFSYSEYGTTAGGVAPVYVFDNNVTCLPPNLLARRVPLCFLADIDHGDFSLTLRLDTGESYSFSKLGYDTAPFADAVEKQTRKLREDAMAAVKEIDTGLTTAQASQLSKTIPRGAAAPIGSLSGISPTFLQALERKIAASRAHESYRAFTEICDKDKVWIGFRKNESISNFAANAESSTQDEAPDPYLLWMIAPSPDGRFAAVEFAEKDSATFVYKTGGDYASFVRRLNRALEAIGFSREAIRLTDAELRKPENSGYYMAAKRTAALQLVRSNYVGRIIHSSPEAWRRKLAELWGTE